MEFLVTRGTVPTVALVINKKVAKQVQVKGTVKSELKLIVNYTSWSGVRGFKSRELVSSSD